MVCIYLDGKSCIFSILKTNSIHLSTCPPVHLSTCPPVHLSTCPHPPSCLLGRLGSSTSAALVLGRLPGKYIYLADRSRMRIPKGQRWCSHAIHEPWFPESSTIDQTTLLQAILEYHDSFDAATACSFHSLQGWEAQMNAQSLKEAVSGCDTFTRCRELAKSATTGPPELSDSQPERYSQQLAPWQVLQAGVVIMCHPETDIQKIDISTMVKVKKNENSEHPFQLARQSSTFNGDHQSRANFLCYTAVFMQ